MLLRTTRSLAVLVCRAKLSTNAVVFATAHPRRRRVLDTVITRLAEPGKGPAATPSAAQTQAKDEELPAPVQPSLLADELYGDDAAGVEDDGPPTDPSKSEALLLSLPERTLVYKLHVYAGRNNTIISLAKPDGGLVKNGWMSGGRVGAKKSNRATPETAYRCMKYMFEVIGQELKSLGGNTSMQIVLCLCGFGHGRDAAYRSLLTTEGAETARLITRLVDTTPIKIGGTRAQKARRL